MAIIGNIFRRQPLKKPENPRNGEICPYAGPCGAPAEASGSLGARTHKSTHIPHAKSATETVGAHRRNAAGIPAEKRPPRGVFHLHKGGRGGAGPDPHTCRSRNPPLEDPPQFFGQIFWEKILEIKIVLLASPRRGRSSRSDSAAIGQRSWHRWSISRTAIEPKRKRGSARFRTIRAVR